MAIQPGHVANYNTLIRAFKDGNVALMECTDKKTGAFVTTLCMVSHDGDELVFVPVAKFFDGNPYEELDPASPNLLEN